MGLLSCTECGKEIPNSAVICPDCGIPAVAISPPLDKYSKVPWFRRSGVNTFFILVGVGSKGMVPLTLLTCYLVLTGEIYYKNYDSEGNLRTWSKGNKVAAIIILVANITLFWYSFFF